MGSFASPLPTYGNPTGMGMPGANPNYMTEIFGNLNNFVPGGAKGTVPLGNVGATPFTGTGEGNGGGGGGFPTPMPILPIGGAPTSAPPNPGPVGGNPNNVLNPGVVPPNGGGGGGTGLTFGYPSVPTSIGVGLTGPGGSSINPGSQITNSGGVGAQAGRPTQFGYLYRNLGGIYGGGEIGKALANFLNNGAGYNQGVVDTLVNNMQPYVQQGLNSIAEMFGASGQRFGSTAALASGQTLASYLNQEQGLMAQMYMWSIQNMMSVLMGGKYQPGNNESLLGGIGKSLLSNLPGAAAAGIGAATAAGGTAGAGALAGLIGLL